jgi:hypothetical protein
MCFRKHFIFFFLAFIGMKASSQKIYKLDIRELKDYMVEAREPGPSCFITYLNGDTIRGESLEINVRKKTLMLDGKSIPLVSKSRIYSLQDKDGFYIIGSYLEDGLWHADLKNRIGRIARGRISLYASTETINANGNTHTGFELLKDENWSKASSGALAQMVSDYPPATEKLNQEFQKISGKESNNYREIIAVLTVYNNR